MSDLDFAQFDNSQVDKTIGVGRRSASPTSAPAVPDAWLDAEGFRWAVLRIIDERLREETERRAWRRGSEVF